MAPFIHSFFRLNCSTTFLRLSNFQNQTRNGGIVSIALDARRRLFSTAEASDTEVDVIHDDGRAMDKENALRRALTQLSGEFGKESMLSLQRFFGSRSTPVISTGSLKLDMALGIGGLPKGRMVEIYGREASGKTTLALNIIKEAQKLGGYCAYLDVENAMDPSLAESIGVNMNNLLLSPPDSAENLLSTIDTLTKSGSVDVIVVDSVAALVPQQELDSLIGEGVHMQSRILNQALRKIHYSLCRSETLIIFLNQTRSGLKSGQVLKHADEVTCGGTALKFYSAVRLRMMRTGVLKYEDKVTGLGLRVQVVKNKLAPAMKKAELEILFGRGFRHESEILELASECGIIRKEGANYHIEGKIFSNEHKAEKYLAKHDLVRDELVAAIRRQLFKFRSC